MIKGLIMKGLLHIILILCSICLAEAMPDSSAILTIPVNDHHFGRIMENKGNVRHKFTFTNTGSIPLTITNIRTTCGCTVPRWSREQVLPGNDGFFEIELDPSGYSGPFHKTIQVQSTARNSNMFVTISGVIIPSIEAEMLPQKLGDLNVKTDQVNFGYIYKGQTGTQNIFVANYTDKKIKIGFKNDNPGISLKADPPVLAPGAFGEIEVRFNSQNSDEWDMSISRIPVILNDREDENVRLVVTANIREDFRNLTAEQNINMPVAVFERDTFDYGTLTNNNPVRCQFKVYNDGRSDLIIRAVKSSCGCTAVIPEKDTLTPGESTFIDALFRSKEHNGDFQYAITVITNDPRSYKKLLFIKGDIKQ